jgi:hypothetical protein
MTAHIRLVSSEDQDGPGLEGKAIGLDEATVGLPEEAGRSEQNRHNEMLGEAAPPLFAEPEDRADGHANGGERPKGKGALARLMAFARPLKAKAAATLAGSTEAEARPESDRACGNRVEKDPEADLIDTPTSSVDGARERPKAGFAKFIALARSPKATPVATITRSVEAEPETDEDAVVKAGTGADPIVVLAYGDAASVANGTDIGVSGATAAAKARRPLFRSKGTIVVVLLTGVAATAVMIWTWPHPAHPPQVVEPGMLTDQPTKLMAPSAALAKVSPREEPNVSRDRPEVHETHGDEVKEVLSFKGLDPTAQPPSSQPTVSSPVGDSVTSAKPAVSPVAASAQPTAAASKPEAVAPLPPPPTPDVVPPPAPEERGFGEAAKIETRLGELEAALKDRSNMRVTRADVDKAETQTSGQIAQLAAIVTRLTGQVKDLQGAVQTMSSGSETKFADLTRRVSMSESKNAVAAAERASDSQSTEGSAASSVGVTGQAQGARMKAAALDQKHNYRIQAASPGLAMLSAIDGGADTRPVEIAIGTDLPGYGKVRSIEQHGQAWIVKTDRGEID